MMRSLFPVILLLGALASCSPAAPPDQSPTTASLSDRLTQGEAEAMAAKIRPLHFGGGDGARIAELQRTDSYLITAAYKWAPKPGDQVKTDPYANRRFDRVRIIDADTVIRTSMGNVLITVGDHPPWIHHYNITDVIHRNGHVSEWQIVHEHVSTWPSAEDDQAGLLNDGGPPVALPPRT